MKKIFFLLAVILLSSCATKKPVDDDYIKAMKNLKAGNYATAAEIFEKIEDDKPFTKEATDGLIMSAYSYYKAEQYEDSIRVIDYFVQSNPINQNLDYMNYLKALDYYSRMQSMNKARDIIEDANSSFKDLLYKYPNSIYVEDSQKKLSRVQSFLSGNDLNIADYYLKRKNYLGAMNHYINVLNNYPNSEYVPESLYRLMQINFIFGLNNDANHYKQILLQKYKNSEWANIDSKLTKNI